MSSEAIKPCPFCEGEAQMIPRAMPASVRYYVECEECGCSQLTHRLEADAITEWNTRTDHTAGLLETLQEAVTVYGKPGGPWNVPSDPGGWLDRALAAIARAGA